MLDRDDRSVPCVIVLEIFQYLDLYSLLKCRLVCSGFQYLIDTTANLQYEIELAVAGQQDGSYGDMFTRQEMFKMHQKRWDGLQWTEVLRGPMMSNCRAWGVHGGVLAQASSETYTLHLKRIPSQSRGIKERNWILDLSTFLGEGPQMGDFGIDPGQDLLAIMASAGDSVRIHILTLSKGERHPLTSGPCLVPHDLHFFDSWEQDLDWFFFDICHDFLSVYSMSCAVLWNWKTGQLLMRVVDSKITSMVFLNERYVLMAITSETPCLLAVDFLAVSLEQRYLDELENYFIFRFPDISHSSPVDDIVIRSNPRPTWADTDPSVPFSMLPQNRLFAVHLSSDNSTDAILCFAILEASLLSLIKTGLRFNNNSFDWSMWGPEHSRALPDYSYSFLFPVSSHGTRLAMQRYLSHRGICVDIYDFNQLGCRNKTQDSDVETPGNVNLSESSEITEGRPICILGPTRIKTNFFRDEVDTRLGYSMTSWLVPGKTWHAGYMSAICSEDAVIIMDEYNQTFEIYTV
ncbi:hypothetical protein JOM56_003117 [Amanita muscaria]